MYAVDLLAAIGRQVAGITEYIGCINKYTTSLE